MQLTVMTGGALFLGGRLLVVKRVTEKEFMPGMWEIPGGRIEEYEGIAGCVEREFREETGIRVKAMRPYNTWCERHGEKFYIEVDFIVQPEGKIKGVNISGEHSEFKWLKRNEIRLLRTSKEMEQAIRLAFKQGT